MSEQGWRSFLVAEGVEDWVVLHGGATAVFRVGSLAEAARLAGAVAKVPHLDGSGEGVQEVQLAIAAKRDAMDAGFWRPVLGYVPMAEDNAVDPLGHGSTVWLQELDETKALRHAMHLDVSVAREHVTARLEAALAVVDVRKQKTRLDLAVASTLRPCRNLRGVELTHRSVPPTHRSVAWTH